MNLDLPFIATQYQYSYRFDSTRGKRDFLSGGKEKEKKKERRKEEEKERGKEEKEEKKFNNTIVISS